MPRQKISEFRAKTILCAALGQTYTGLPLDVTANLADQLKNLPPHKRYSLKVDQGVKGRFKQGLVLLNRSFAQLAADARTLTDRGFQYLLVEPYIDHDANGERYLMLQRTRGGLSLLTAQEGGVEVERQAANLEAVALGTDAARTAAALAPIERNFDLKGGVLERLVQAFEDNHLTFLEINPFVVIDGQIQLLDAAAEVDDAATPLVQGRWTPADFRHSQAKNEHELAVEALAATSRASLRLTVLNPNGAVFLLLSGGGASIVLADEVAGRGFGSELANYGEYSGNPSSAEAYRYAREIITLMLESKAERKVLIIAGGVANFTDVRTTFQGIIQALEEAGDLLRRQGVTVFVRRGGPFEAEGLALITHHLQAAGLLGLVAGPELPLADIVPLALAALQSEAR